MAAEGDNKRPIIIKKVEEGHHGHHGGAWKVAYADFVTAMMAFFLLLWLLGSTTEEQRKGIADYFNPSIAVSSSPSGAGGMLGGITIAVPGAMSSSGSPVSAEGVPSGATQNVGGAPDAEESGDAVPETSDSARRGERTGLTADGAGGDPGQSAAQQAAQAAREEEDRRFAEAEKTLRDALRAFPELKDVAGSVVVDRTPEGLRIQLVDQANYSLFPSGGAAVAGRTQQLLDLVTRAVGTLPNKVSIRGHTDARPFAAGSARDNWVLSAERANATRLAMQEGGLAPGRVASVVGLADVDPFVAGDPLAPQNRRMSIILLAEHSK
jgi:chemotaxis protein MotB